MSSNSSSKSGGIGFLGMLTILFIGLKLTKYIDWSWLWVLSPLWIPIAIAGLFFVSFWIVYLFVLAFGAVFGRKNRFGVRRKRNPWDDML